MDEAVEGSHSACRPGMFRGAVELVCNCWCSLSPAHNWLRTGIAEA